MGEDRITMTKRELERYQAVQRSLRGEITQAKTGELISDNYFSRPTTIKIPGLGRTG